MDIPNTGAIFTLGKSHLADNTQSYFYIKNDSIQRLIAGPYQSAVICESGRLFVWGENHYGQLGVNHNLGSENNNHKQTSEIYNNVVGKPTCVKLFKNLRLKVADLAFGRDWSVILTCSNEIFFTGHNIFPSECLQISRNFSSASIVSHELTLQNIKTMKQEISAIVRKPFKLKDFDVCLKNNKETEKYVNILAGNQHFALLTSNGRLIGWGSNKSHQLGTVSVNAILKPYEMVFDSAVKQYACGPESTLVLTENDNLYLTGCLNEFEFTQFTELQKNLSTGEEIIFMHISQSSEIFIVTNTGRIYRSYESRRNKSLIFQRFYDYDSEEHGHIRKLLKGDSFCAVITKMNKFYTTFSDSGHHLKTFREISKFKNLKLMDIALGNQHILVHGLPRSNLSGSLISDPITYGQEPIINITNLHKKHRASSHMKNTDLRRNIEYADHNETNNNMNLNNSLTEITNTTTNGEALQSIIPIVNNESITNCDSTIYDINANGIIANVYNSEKIETSPSNSLKSHKSICLVKPVNNPVLNFEKLLQHPTPYPEVEENYTIINETSLRNICSESGGQADYIESISPESLAIKNTDRNTSNFTSIDNENAVVYRSVDKKPTIATSPFESDEKLTVEISEIPDPIDRTIMMNEIRFINDGIDVTDNVKTKVYLNDFLDDTNAELEEPNRIYESMNNYNESNTINSDELNAFNTKLATTNTTIVTTNGFIKSPSLEGPNLNSNSKQKQLIFIENKKDHMATIVPPTKENNSDEYNFQDTDNQTETNTIVKEYMEIEDTKLASDNQNIIERNVKNVIAKTNQNEENFIHSVKDIAHQLTEETDNNVTKSTNSTKNAVNNAFKKLADDTRNVTDTVACKISSEVLETKHNISTLLPHKKNKIDVDILSPNRRKTANQFSKETYNALKSNNESKILSVHGFEIDEHTTASINSMQTYSYNPCENHNPFDDCFETNEIHNGFQNKKKNSLVSEQGGKNTIANNELAVENTDSKVTSTKFTKFINDIRKKSCNISCGNENALRIEDDQIHNYPEGDDTDLETPQKSKICTIL